MPSQLSLSDAALADALKRAASELGFDLIGIAPAARPDTLDFLQSWLQDGRHGSMEYMARRSKAYSHPDHVLQGVKSVIMVAMNYGPGVRGAPGSGQVASYAQGTLDYHDVLRERLRKLADVLHEHRPQARSRTAIDTAPLLERDFARQSGLGWFGKNTMLINRRRGSYFFLGAILSDCELPADAPHATSHCGTCTRCLEACPTDAFPAPYVLDAQRCISYLTIELRGRPIPADLRTGMGEWLFGCDVCQQVCPWNRHEEASAEPAFQPAREIVDVSPAELLSCSEDEFARRFSETPLARPGRTGLAQNAAIVLGNRKDPSDVPILVAALSDPSAVVRGAVVWALGQSGEPAALAAIQSHAVSETEPSVLEEIAAAITRLNAAAGSRAV